MFWTNTDVLFLNGIMLISVYKLLACSMFMFKHIYWDICFSMSVGRNGIERERKKEKNKGV